MEKSLEKAKRWRREALLLGEGVAVGSRSLRAILVKNYGCSSMSLLSPRDPETGPGRVAVIGWHAP